MYIVISKKHQNSYFGLLSQCESDLEDFKKIMEKGQNIGH